MKTAVIGAGIGGLAVAALLAKAGQTVTLFEKNERVGGKLGWLEEGGYTWDTGPSLLTMPHVFQRLWAQLGRRLEDDLTLIPLPITCRYRWTDGTCIDEDAAFWRRPEVARFLEYARGLYEVSAGAFLENPLGEWHRQLTWANLPKLRHLPKIASFQTLDQTVRRFFGPDRHLVQLFDRFATYNGSSPYQTPTAFNIIAYVEAHFGGWYIRGGLFEIARALERICRELGVEIHLGHEVKTRPAGFDATVCNQDVLSAIPRFLGKVAGQAPRRPEIDHPAARPSPREMSMSGLVMYLGVERSFPRLSHHNIFFSDDYPAEFRQIFAGQPADEPTIYVAIHSKADPARAPAGCENWFVLVNAPCAPWTADAQGYGDGIIGRLETRFGCAGLRAAIRVRRHFTPSDFETRYLAHAGSLYGYASHGVRAAFQRPAMSPKGAPGFYFVGGSTHPGGGLPLVVLGAQMAARKVLAQSPSL